MTLIIWVTISLILASIFYNFATYDSRPLIPFYWILAGAVLGPLLLKIFPNYRAKEFKFYVAISLMTAMLFAGFGFFAKAQINKNRHLEIINFPKAPAKLISCRSGEENPGKHRNPVGRFFPIWTYEFSKNNSDTKIISNSNSMADFSIREKFKSKSEAEAACLSWKADETRQIYYDPLMPELSLMEIPKEYHLFGIDVFLAILFSLVSLAGLMAILRTEKLKNA